jgi:hypothetical protein
MFERMCTRDQCMYLEGQRKKGGDAPVYQEKKKSMLLEVLISNNGLQTSITNRRRYDWRVQNEKAVPIFLDGIWGDLRDPY